jgi:DNA invertase Pin-like site-specific DNA recombinase
MARTSRKNAAAPEAIQQVRLYKTAVYARLSLEDSGKKDSDTIENQVYLVEQYIKQNPQLKVISTYVDNGETGVNFNRPGFTRLMNDIKEGKIDCIVVKDLSRFGRNYIETGEYLDKILPFMGVRFISINDSYDSETADGNAEGLIVALKNLINDAYVKDISSKVMATVITRQQNGEFVSGFAPYGYKRSEENRRKLVPDEETADIARDIFKWRAEGMSCFMIARKLNEMGISSPYKRRIEKGLMKGSPRHKNPYWQGQMIKRITDSPMYIGHMTQGRTKQSISDGLPYKKLKPADWIIVENTHEALIDMETWEKVRALRAEAQAESERIRGKYAHIGNNNNVFKSLLICDDCGSKLMRYKGVSNYGGVSYTYICPVRTQNLDMTCTNKRVREKDLFELVYQEISKKIEQSVELEKLLERLNKRKNGAKESLQAKIADMRRKIGHTAELRATLYESYVDKLLSETEYIEMKAKYDADTGRFKAQLEALQAESLMHCQTLTPQNKWLTAIRKFKDGHTVTREMAVALIDKIIVSGYNSTEIIWNFKDELAALEEYAKGAEK